MKIDSIHSYAYAKAIFSLALQQNKLADWEKFLNYFTRIAQFKDVTEYCNMPASLYSTQTDSQCIAPIDPKQEPVDLLITLLQELQITLLPEMLNFIQLVLQKKRLELLPHISKIFQEMYAEYSKILRVKVITVQQLTDSEKQKLIDDLAHHYGYTIELEQEIAAELIGGAIIRIKDKIIDGSVAGQLRRLRACL